MNIALDAMGGDHAPKAVVDGALQAAPELKGTLYLVGIPDALKPYLPKELPRNVVIQPASQAVGMDEKPLEAYRKKKDSSLMVAAKMVKDGLAQAMVSAGNTGACSVTAQLCWRQLPGIHRPAIVSRIPNLHGGFALLDSGASPDVDPEHLVEFAIMGRAYAQQVMGRRDPKVFLLNIGEEEGKGNAFAKQSYHLLKRFPWFAGNCEGKDMFLKPTDVVVCDAFVGNVVLKSSEGLAEAIAEMLRAEVPDNPLQKWMYWPVRRVTAPLKQHMDWAAVGGSPLLGLNGICTISHGRSDARAIKNALLVTQSTLEKHLLDSIREAVRRDLGENEHE